MRTRLGNPTIDRYLVRVVNRCRTVLAARLVGVYLINSAARGDHVAGRSDLDVAVIVDASLDAPTKRALVDRLRHRSLPVAAPRLELVVYPRSVAAAPGPSPAFEVNLNTGRAIDDHVTLDPAHEPPHWFVLDLAAAADRAQPLCGPPPSTVFGPVPVATVVAALRASQDWHARHDSAAPNRVLNDCRAWLWLTERRWASKTDAARWAIAAGGDEELIEAALARRSGRSEAELPADRVRRHAGRIAVELATALETSRRDDVKGER